MNAVKEHVEKGGRIIAVDIARILAAMCIMYAHLSWYSTYDQVHSMSGTLTRIVSRIPQNTFGTINVVFFFLAGYFACNNITWKKALDNAWWCFAPFVLWNVICMLSFAPIASIPENTTWYNLFGINSFVFKTVSFNPTAVLGADGFTHPVNGPLWFMRDLIFLFLLSPVLFRCARFLFPLLVVLSMVPFLERQFVHSATHSTLSCYSVLYFTAGCYLRCFSLESQRKFLEYYSPLIICLYCAIVYLERELMGRIYFASLHNLVSLWVFYQIARWVEVKVPVASKIALRYAPVTFLTYAAHWCIYPYLPFKDSDIALLYPVVVFVACALVFMLLKCWGRPLLHLVAHCKLRQGK